MKCTHCNGLATAKRRREDGTYSLLCEKLSCYRKDTNRKAVNYTF